MNIIFYSFIDIIQSQRPGILLYNHLKFYSFDDLKLQMKAYLHRSNRIPMSVLNWLTPVEKRNKLLPI